MTREIPLTRGQVALVDDDDYADTMKHIWSAAGRRGGPYYAATSVPDTSGTGKRVMLRLHTFLTGWPLVDHINNNGLDNRRQNLRQATTQQNNMNQRVRADNRAGYKGVRRFGPGRWMARIQANGVPQYLGLHPTAEDAARAYDIAARREFGEFAHLNFPDVDTLPAEPKAATVASDRETWKVNARRAMVRSDDGRVVTISLSQGYVAVADAVDYARLAKHLWFARTIDGGKPSACARIGAKTISMQRHLTGWSIANHINGDTLDNRRCNLRQATLAESVRTQSPQRNNTSGFKGVSLNTSGKRARPWQAMITVDRKAKCLGLFATPEEAARAYDAAARRVAGDFAWLNFPDEPSGPSGPAPPVAVLRNDGRGYVNAACVGPHPRSASLANHNNLRTDRR